MASVQAKKGKNGKKTHYVVVSHAGKHKWLRTGTMQQAKILKREIDSLEQSRRAEKLGLSTREIRIDDFFQEYADYVRLHNSPATVKRYLVILNTFIVFLKMFHWGVRRLSQIQPSHIESYKKQRRQDSTATDG